jgi:AraC-like DNA-binding protein
MKTTPASKANEPVTSGTSSALGGYAPAIAAALESRGIDSRAMFAAAGFDHVPVNSPVDRLPVPQIQRLYDAVADVTGDDTFGLDVAEHMRATTLHALGYSLQASNNLRDFGDRLSRYMRFVSQSAKVHLAEHEADVAIEAHKTIARIPDESTDAMCGFLVRFISDLSGGRCRPHRLELPRPEPADGGKRHREFFQAPVDFDRPFPAIRYERSMLGVTFDGASKELAQHNDQIVIAYLAKLDRADIQDRVKALIIQDLPSRKVSKVSIAKQLHMSPRTLQHKLAQCNASFYGLVNETRRAIACGYMENHALAVTEIAYLLGFSDTSNFSRAFKRWTGLSPSAYRSAAMS